MSVDRYTEDQSSWPEHLRDDAPYQRCSRCHRKTWDVGEFGQQCRMPQTWEKCGHCQSVPLCSGTFESEVDHG